MAEGTGAGPWLTLPRLWLVVVLGATVWLIRKQELSVSDVSVRLPPTRVPV